MKNREFDFETEGNPLKNSVRSLLLLAVFSGFLVGVLYLSSLLSQAEAGEGYRDFGDAVYTVAGNLSSYGEDAADIVAPDAEDTARQAAVDAYIKAHNAMHGGPK